MKSLRVAVVGALGAVGQQMISILETSALDISMLKPLDIAENVGKAITFRDKTWTVEESGEGKFSDIDIALFSAGADASKVLAPLAVSEGAIVIDNSSQWRMTEGIPLVVPEVNPQALQDHKGIIANPNCSTIQMLVALKPLHDAFDIKRVVVSTYQAVSGSGAKAIEELRNQTKACLAGEICESQVYPHQIAFNVLPQIDVFLDGGYTKEEMKMVHETHKILDPRIAVCPTAVRVPVYRSHSESINLQFTKSYELKDVFALLSKAPGVEVIDDPANLKYPLAIEAEGKNAVYVGRIRRDDSLENGLNLWVVSDNLRKGAALNAVQIAEKMVEMGLVG